MVLVVVVVGPVVVVVVASFVRVFHVISKLSMAKIN